MAVLFYALAPTANQNQTLFTVGDGKEASFNLNIVNRGDQPVKVRLAYAAADTPTDAEWFEYNAVLEANGGILERTANRLPAGKKVVIWTDTATISVIAMGDEE